MNQPPVPPPPKRKTQLQGPRPPDLKVSKDSHQIRKPPPHPQQIHHNQQQQIIIQPQEPVVIYTVSPKVIHTTVSEFSSMVQRLTGLSPTSPGDLSPAARLASIEKTSPSERERERERRISANTSSNIFTDDFGMNFEGVGMDPFPSILSPAPMNLSPIPTGYFSPVPDMQTFPVSHHELSPLWPGSNIFMASPSALLSAPSPSSFDVFYNLFDF